MADEYLNKTGLSRFWDKIKTKIPDITGKADKVSNATNGNFAALDSNGNLTDSGHKHSDYLTQHQDISGKADKVSNPTTGGLASLDSNGNLTNSGYILDTSAVGQESGLIKKTATNKLTAYFCDVLFDRYYGHDDDYNLDYDQVYLKKRYNSNSANAYTSVTNYYFMGILYRKTITLSTSTTTSVTFNDGGIELDSDAMIDVYTSIPGVNPISISGSQNLTITFPAYSSAATMDVIIKVYQTRFSFIS